MWTGGARSSWAARDEAELLFGELAAERGAEAAKLALEREARLSVTALVGQQARELERLKARTAAHVFQQKKKRHVYQTFA